MKISYAWLSTYFDTKLPAPEKLAELLSAHAFEVEGIEKAPDGDTVLDVKVLPDRAHYALSHRGIAGEASAVTGLPRLATRLAEAAFPLTEAIPGPQVNVRDERLCRRYIAERIENVAIKDSPADLKARLEAIGARSINSIVDATNFVMFDLGQPLHAFDADKIKGSITVRKAQAGEKITLLDGREVDLLESDLLIADDEGPLVIAGVKGGKRAEVTSATKNIILEAANFDPSSVRCTSTRNNLRNDSSKRFENEITPEMALGALRQAAAYILKLSPGAKAGQITDIYPKPVQPWRVSVDSGYVNAVTGLSLSVQEMEDILARIGCAVSTQGKTLAVTPPLDRLDMMIPEDVADEIVRLYGYDRLSSKETPAVPPTPLDKTFYWAEKIKNALVDLGFSETLLYTLVPKGAFEISYPLASDKAALRERLAPALSQSLVLNGRNADLLGLEAIRIFEIGKIFPKIGEKTSLCIGVSQIKKRKGVTSESLLREAVVALESKLGAKIGGKIEIGTFGAVLEIDFDALISPFPTGSLKDLGFVALPRDMRYKPFSLYPFIARDIALFVPSGTKDADVGDVIRDSASNAAGDLLVKGPDLFDRFEKDGKISYAFHMIFQSFKKTLSDEEANGFMTKVYEAVKSKGWETR